MSEAPKSAFELAMEKLKKQDVAAGVEAQVLTEAQRAAITEAKASTTRASPNAASCTSQTCLLSSIRRRSPSAKPSSGEYRAVRDGSQRQDQENPGRRVNRPRPTLLQCPPAPNSGVLEGRPLPFA